MAKPLTGEQTFGMLFVVCLTAGPIARIVAGYRHRSQQTDIDATLKMEMINRGTSADEMERVLRAKTLGAWGKTLSQTASNERVGR